MRAAWAAPCAVALVVMLAATAGGHAILLDSSPKPDEVTTAPGQLVLRFNGRIEGRLSSVVLIGGPRMTRIVLGTSGRSERADVMIYPLPSLAPGKYRVEWKAFSVDGHVTGGMLRFTIAGPAERAKDR